MIRVDFRACDAGIAAALSGDRALLSAYSEGDVYMELAVAAELAPVGATKTSHPHERELAKKGLLLLIHGGGPKALKKKLGISLETAGRLHAAFRRHHPGFVNWASEQKRKTRLVFPDGWRIKALPMTMRSALIQWAGAEILRQSTIQLDREGVAIIATHHDAIWLVAPSAEADLMARRVVEVMSTCSALVLGGFRLGAEDTIVPYPRPWSEESERFARCLELAALVAQGGLPTLVAQMDGRPSLVDLQVWQRSERRPRIPSGPPPV